MKNYINFKESFLITITISDMNITCNEINRKESNEPVAIVLIETLTNPVDMLAIMKKRN